MGTHLRLILILTTALLLAACTRDRPTPTPTATGAAAETPTPASAPVQEPEVTVTTPEATTETPAPEGTATPEEPTTFQYTVQPGDTLFSIAQKFGTDVETIRQLNALADDNIIVGQPLYVPYVEGMTAEGLPTPTPGPYRYVIQSGDTLSAIALRFGVAPIQIMEANNLLDPNTLTVGAEIIIPNYQPPAETGTAGTGGQAAQGEPVIHVVQPGEGLYEIAVKYGVSAAEIAAVNNITNRNLLRVGQELIIPGVTRQQVIAERGIVHVVQPGESLLGIAIQYGVDVEAIIEINDITDPDALSVGQELVIPVQQ